MILIRQHPSGLSIVVRNGQGNLNGKTASAVLTAEQWDKLIKQGNNVLLETIAAQETQRVIRELFR